ncbi:DUF4262 domain-containing protein [Streptomyces sp. NPDC059467]|uniref:DUF4262 domain-containing protein n=1 Tax=Streptomyces sp. NPDC059467 TaxID=3346844 RepID=UPI00369D2509
MVPEDEICPGFAYTIGLSHTHGAPELAMFGLDIHDTHRMLNRLGAKSAAGAALAGGQSRADIVDGQQVALRQVDLRWYRTFFGRAIGFYRRPPFPVLQAVWPDADDRFHWEPPTAPTSSPTRRSVPPPWAMSPTPALTLS